MTSNTKDKNKIFYGWWLVLVCVIILAFGSGTTIYLYSLVAGVVTEEFGTLRAASMLGMTSMVVLVAFMSPKIGSLIDTRPIRRVLYGGALALGLGFILMSQTTNVLQVAIIYALFLSVGLAALGQLAGTALICRWFTRSRGLALGIMGLGTQLGGFFFPPIVAALMSEYGWRTALGVLGVFILLVVPLLIRLTVYDYPADKGLAPEPESCDAPPALVSSTLRPAEAPTIPTSTLLSNPSFWVVVLFVAASAGTNFALVGNLAVFGTDIGASREKASLLIAVFALVGIFSSPLFGRLTDKFDPRSVAVIALSLTGVSLAMILQAKSYEALFMAAALLGVGGGTTLPLWTSMIGHFFPVHIVGRVLGLSTLFANPVMAFFALYSGWAHDLTGSYDLTILTMLGACTLAGILALWSRLSTAGTRSPSRVV